MSTAESRNGKAGSQRDTSPRAGPGQDTQDNQGEAGKREVYLGGWLEGSLENSVK